MLLDFLYVSRDSPLSASAVAAKNTRRGTTSPLVRHKTARAPHTPVRICTLWCIGVVEVGANVIPFDPCVKES